MNKEIKKTESDTESVLSNTIQALAEGITGISASSKKELVLSIGSIFQRLRGADFLSILREEWGKYRERGRIKEDYQFTEQHKACLGELLEFLDKDQPDELRFSVIKQIFLVAAEEKVSDRNDVMPLQYIKIARNLTDGEVLILNACYKATKDESLNVERKDDQWHKYISDNTGLLYKELIELHVKNLEEKSLLLPPKYGDRSGIIFTPYFRLTELGYNFCNYINSYECIT